jgi:hypothetical protein
MPLSWCCISCGGSYSDTMPYGVINRHSCPPQIRGADGKFIDTPNPRDENPVVTRLGIVTGIQAEGRGVKCLSDSPLTEPRWITEMKERVAKREDANDD